MRSIILFVCSLSTVAFTSIQVDLCDPVTLERYFVSTSADIMMGMKIAVVVSSDSNDLWSGGLFIEDEDRGYGKLLGRGKDPNSRDWTQSHLPSAGEGAQVTEWNDSVRWGFDLYTDELTREQGRLFLIDYVPVQPGMCSVKFYNHTHSWTIPDPNITIEFNATPTRDLVQDGIVNLADFAAFSSDWQVYTGTDPNLFSSADFSRDGYVDLADLCMFTDYWMYGIPGWKPKDKLPEPQPEPDITYSIRTAEGLSELTLAVGQSVTLYIDQLTDGEAVFIIELEANISDPNLGCIDNTPIDPNNPPGTGTARILFEPRNTSFDYWGPGMTQPEGIKFAGASIFSRIADGPITSFVYTATAEGTVVLNLCDYISFSNLENIVIYQVPEEQGLMSGSQTYSMTTSTSESSFETLQDESESLAERTSSPDEQLTTTEPEATLTPDEMADWLEDIWKSEAQLRSETDKQSWDQFIESVRNSQF